MHPIETLKQLDNLVKLCRKRGVLEFEGLGVKLKLTDAPLEVSNKKRSKTNNLSKTPELDKIEEDVLAEQDLIFWSSESPAQKLAEEQTEQ